MNIRRVLRSSPLLAVCCLFAQAASLKITTTSLPDGTVGHAYFATLSATGGQVPYTWSFATGAAPPGLSLSAAGVIAGTPTSAGTYNFTVKADSAAGNGKGNDSSSDTQSLTIRVYTIVSITSGSLPDGQVGAAYSQFLQVSGGIPPYSWSVIAGSLPAGLRFAGGQISGTPTSTGTATFTVRAADAAGSSATKALTITILSGMTIPNCPTPTAVVGQSYASTLAAAGGTPPYSWKISVGSLPAGLSLDSQRFTISGIPQQAGSFAFLLQADDSSANSTSRSCTIQVSFAPLTITSAATLPNGFAGVPYSQVLTVAGGHAPYLWSMFTTGAPQGFVLQPATGLLSGVPAAAGTFSFTVQVQDQDGNTTQQRMTLVISATAPLNITITGLTDVVNPAQQLPFALQLDSAYPTALSGTLTLTFAPDPSVGMDDPAVQFATGGRSLSFTVPANSRTPSFAAPVLAIQSGTVAGNIQMNVQVQAAGTNVAPGQGARIIRVDRLAPKMSTVQVVQTATGFDVSIVGFTTTRDVTQGIFHFSGGPATPMDVTIPLATAGKTWFQSVNSQQFGGQFKLVQSFVWQGTPAQGLNSVSVTLSNAQGASDPVAAKF